MKPLTRTKKSAKRTGRRYNSVQALMEGTMNIKWTKKKPTKPGWYWLHWPETGDVMVVGLMPQRAYGGRLCGHTSFTGLIPIDEFPNDMRWAGPIPEPKDN